MADMTKDEQVILGLLIDNRYLWSAIDPANGQPFRHSLLPGEFPTAAGKALYDAARRQVVHYDELHNEMVWSRGAALAKLEEGPQTPDKPHVLISAAVSRMRKANAANPGVKVFDLAYRVAFVAKIDFVPIPAGKFLMGSPPDEPGRFVDEIQHEVAITRPFLMARTPVTEAQYAAVTGVGPSSDLPVVNVSWDAAAAFCEKLSAQIGKIVRLPTEAEWEHACRAGTTGPTYGPVNEIAWTDDNSEADPLVGLKKPNAFGLHDMLGNVWEWCSDWYGPYPEGPVADPQGPPDGAYHVLRGGTWRGDFASVRSARRHCSRRGGGCVGFRVVLVGG